MPRYIDADALGIGYANPKVFNSEEYARGWNSVIEIINSAPTLSPDDVRGAGKWISAYCSGVAHKRCSECGTYIEDVFFAFDYSVNYCPSCGAKMEVSEDA